MKNIYQKDQQKKANIINEQSKTKENITDHIYTLNNQGDIENQYNREKRILSQQDDSLQQQFISTPQYVLNRNDQNQNNFGYLNDLENEQPSTELVGEKKSFDCQQFKDIDNFLQNIEERIIQQGEFQQQFIQTRQSDFNRNDQIQNTGQSNALEPEDIDNFSQNIEERTIQQEDSLSIGKFEIKGRSLKKQTPPSLSTSTDLQIRLENRKQCDSIRIYHKQDEIAKFNQSDKFDKTFKDDLEPLLERKFITLKIQYSNKSCQKYYCTGDFITFEIEVYLKQNAVLNYGDANFEKKKKIFKETRENFKNLFCLLNLKQTGQREISNEQNQSNQEAIEQERDNDQDRKLHPLWSEYQIGQERVNLYFNPYSGQISSTFPTSSQNILKKFYQQKKDQDQIEIRIEKVQLNEQERKIYDNLEKESRLNEMRKVCDHLDLISNDKKKFETFINKHKNEDYKKDQKEKIIQNDIGDCPVCLEKIDDAVITSCLHFHCSECLNNAFNNNHRCPYCRFQLTKKNKFMTLPIYKSSSKIDKIMSILNEYIIGKNDKCVIFTEFLGMMDLLKQQFAMDKIKFLVLDQNLIKQRANIIKQFNDDKSCQVFLISLKVGVGRNLIKANRVIMTEPCLDSALEVSAIEKIDRDQIKKVFVHKLIVQSSIEEILQMPQS